MKRSIYTHIDLSLWVSLQHKCRNDPKIVSAALDKGNESTDNLW